MDPALFDLARLGPYTFTRKQVLEGILQHADSMVELAVRLLPDNMFHRDPFPDLW